MGTKRTPPPNPNGAKKNAVDRISTKAINDTSSISTTFFDKPIIFLWRQWPIHPKGPPFTSRMCLTLPRPEIPLFVVSEGFTPVDHNIAILLIFSRPRKFDLLKPTMRPAYRIRLHCMGNILVNATIPPPNSIGIRIFR